MESKDKECGRTYDTRSTNLSSEEQVKPVHDLKESLELIVSGTGIVHTEYGGFMIEVIDLARFPYGDVITTLIKHGFDIWITLRGERPQIIACVKLD